jgi:hypothetical protein
LTQESGSRANSKAQSVRLHRATKRANGTKERLASDNLLGNMDLPSKVWNEDRGKRRGTIFRGRPALQVPDSSISWTKGAKTGQKPQIRVYLTPQNKLKPLPSRY